MRLEESHIATVISESSISSWSKITGRKLTQGVCCGGQGVMAPSLPPEAAGKQAHYDVLQDVLLAHGLKAPHSHRPATCHASSFSIFLHQIHSS